MPRAFLRKDEEIAPALVKCRLPVRRGSGAMLPWRANSRGASSGPLFTLTGQRCRGPLAPGQALPLNHPLRRQFTQIGETLGERLSPPLISLVSRGSSSRVSHASRLAHPG
jgi:hypothetical protein